MAAIPTRYVSISFFVLVKTPAVIAGNAQVVCGYMETSL